MNLFNIIRDKVVGICQEIGKQKNWPEAKFEAVNAEQPKNPEHGDLATNAAMVLAGQVRQNPRELAMRISSELEKIDMVESTSVAGPGFINIVLKKEIWLQQLTLINKDINAYTKTDIGKGHRANIEFVSTNPTGPMHIGHARNAICGDALANLLDFCGYDVTKEYYVNDAGAQIGVLTESVFIRYLELFGRFDGDFPEGCYPGDYLIPPAQKLKDIHGDKLIDMKAEKRNAIIRPFIVEEMMMLIRADLKLLGVEHEVFTSEQSLHDAKEIEKLVQYLEEKNLVYRGVLEPPKGQKPDDWEERDQLLFRSTNYGDDVDRPLQKSDGSWTYFAADIAYMKHKLDRNFDYLAIFLGADHGGYVKRLKAAAKVLSENKADIDVKLCQLVNYLKNGQQLKMSKRAGTFATVKDIVDMLDQDIIRFMMLTRKNDVVMDFDVDKVVEHSKDNPVFYVQYAHARARSVLRSAKEDYTDAFEIYQSGRSNLSLIDTKAEMALIKNISSWPRQIEQAAQSHEPHRIAYYLESLAAEFHSLWSNKEEQIKFLIKNDSELTAARLTLVDAASKIIKSGLNLIGVEAMDSM
ncbi:MAG: arginine--tRNA ligase [Rickettsiales bacterium]